MVAVFLVAWCAARAQAHTRPAYGGTIRVEISGDPWGPAGSVGRRMVFDGLTRTGPGGRAEPALAVRWASQNGEHRWQFWLRRNLRFHDGSPVTAEAVTQSLMRACTESCPWTSVRPLADSLVFTLASPDPVLPAELARAAYQIAAPDGTSGTGAFRFLSNTAGVLSLAAWDDAWDGRPFVDSVEIAGRRAARNQALDLSTARADLIDLPPEAIHQAQQEHITVLQAPACQLLVLSLALPDEAQRAAAALAVDRATIVSVIFQKQAELTASLLPNALSGYSFLFSAARDLPQAQQMHGATSTTAMTLAVEETSGAMQLAAERLALNLHDAGFRVQVARRGATATPDMTLRLVTLESASPQAALQQMLAAFHQPLTEESADPAVLYREEAAFLVIHRALPLAYLPRAYAAGPRLHGLRLAADGTPLLADASLEPTR